LCSCKLGIIMSKPVCQIYLFSYSSSVTYMKKFIKQVIECSPSSSESSNCNEFVTKLHLTTAGQTPFFHRLLTERIPRSNANVIIDFIISIKREANVSLGYIRLNILTLSDLERYSQHKKFNLMTAEDVLRYFDSLRKSDDEDPMHRWIGTHTVRRGIVTKFFKWLHYSNIEAKKRPKPRVVQNIPKYKRKEQSVYKPTDLWTSEDDLLFLKYCPSKRNRCYHTISRDLSCRPNEILNLRIKDIVFKSLESYQYAEVLVNGKTGTRHIPLINSIPYLKDWLDSHPQRGNSNAFLIPNLSDCGLGKKLSSSGLLMVYRKYKSEFFPNLIQNNNLTNDEKKKIESLLKKPWNPYIH
jgi:integrase